MSATISPEDLLRFLVAALDDDSSTNSLHSRTYRDITNGTAPTGSGDGRSVQITMVDTYRSTDVTHDGTVVRAVRNFRSTNISNQRVLATGEATQFNVKVVNSENEVVSVGLVPSSYVSNENNKLHCTVCGSTGSLGLGLHRGNVVLAYDGDVVFHGSCDTSDPTGVQIELRNGTVSIFVDGRQVNCDWLKRQTFEGSFHLGVSASTKDQIVHVGNAVIGASPTRPHNNLLEALAGALAAVVKHTSGSEGDDEPANPFIPANQRGENVPMQGMCTFALRDDRGFRWMFPFGSITRKDLVAVADAPNAVIFTQQVVKVGTHKNIVCDHCGLGRGPTKFVSNRFKCTDCDDFDLCNYCFFAGSAHQHDRNKFEMALGGAWFECNATLAFNNASIFVAIVPRGEERSFCQQGSIASEAELKAPTSTNQNVDISVTIVKKKATVSVGEQLLTTLELTSGADGFRFAFRFTAAGQSATMQRRGTVPAIGSLVATTHNAEQLQTYARSVATLKVKDDHCNLLGHVIQIDDDGSLKLQMQRGGTLWMPISCVYVQQHCPPLAHTTFKAGDIVIPNPADWIFGGQSGGHSGTVVSFDAMNAKVKVKWQGKDQVYVYRAGARDYCCIPRWDVERYPNVGDEVWRNPRYWKSDNEDGGHGCRGVVAARTGGRMTVKWTVSGKTAEHTYDLHCHEVQFVSPKASGSSSTAFAVQVPSQQSLHHLFRPRPTSPRPPIKVAPLAPQPEQPAQPLPNVQQQQQQQQQPASAPSSFLKRLTQPELKEHEGQLNAIKGVENAPDMLLEDALTLDDELKLLDLSNELAIAKIHAQNMAVRNGGALPHCITEQEAMVLHLFTQDTAFYLLIGSRLRSPKRDLLLPLFPVLKLLFSALKKLPRAQTSQKVYRGVKEDLHAQYMHGLKVMWWSLSSTTPTLDVMEVGAFAGQEGNRTIFHITATDLVSIKEFSANPSEDELILLPGSMMEVTGRANCGNGLSMIEVKQVALPPGMMIDFFR